MPQVHPGYNHCPDDEPDALSQGNGIGIYYLAKFRGLHNHALEPCLIQGEKIGGVSDDPHDVTERKERYTHTTRRNQMEKAIMCHYETQAR